MHTTKLKSNVPATADITQQVSVELKSFCLDRAKENQAWAEGKEAAPDTVQAIVYKRSEPEKDGRVWKQVEAVLEFKYEKIEALKARVRRDYRGRIVEELDLTPVQQALF
jgi:hypothetical protein